MPPCLLLSTHRVPRNRISHRIVKTSEITPGISTGMTSFWAPFKQKFIAWAWAREGESVIIQAYQHPKAPFRAGTYSARRRRLLPAAGSWDILGGCGEADTENKGSWMLETAIGEQKFWADMTQPEEVSESKE